MPTAVAERLIVAGFFAEVFDGFPVPTLRPQPRRGRGRQAHGGAGRMTASIASVPLDELPDGKAHRVEVGGHVIALVRIGDDVYAIGDRCSHQDISLSEGEVLADECTLECWKHGSAFSLETGEPSRCPPPVRCRSTRRASSTARWR